MKLEVENILQEKRVDYRLIKLLGKVKSHEDAKKYIKDADPEGDCKTIVAKDLQNNLYAFFLRGMMKIDFLKVKNILGKKINILNREDLKKITGKEPGTICPFLLKNIKIFLDKRVLQRNKIHFSSGEYEYGLEISTKDLNKIIDFKIADFAQE